MPRFLWTTTLDATLRQLWNAGASATTIGDAMGITKNAVLGRKRRLGMSKRLSPIAWAPESENKPRCGSIDWQNGQRTLLTTLFYQTPRVLLCDIARQMGLSQNAITRRVKALGLERPRYERAIELRRYGSWQVLGLARIGRGNTSIVHARCDCGRSVERYLHQLVAAKNPKCVGCAGKEKTAKWLAAGGCLHPVRNQRAAGIASGVARSNYAYMTEQQIADYRLFRRKKFSQAEAFQLVGHEMVLPDVIPSAAPAHQQSGKSL